VPTGRVARFKPEDGYGFIKPDSGGKDVFVHVADLAPGQGTELLVKDAVVSYEVTDEGKGPRATSVYVMRGEPAEAGQPDFATEVRSLADRYARAFADEVIAAAQARGFRV
jgi:cold shock protein